MEVFVERAHKSAATGKTCVIGFAECSYYNGEQPAKLDTKRFQLRMALAGGYGYVLVADFDDVNLAMQEGEKRQRLAQTITYRVFDVSGLI